MADEARSILDLDPESFMGALAELNLPEDQRAFLTDQYFARQRVLPMTSRPEGRRVGAVLPMSWSPGKTGAEALMSGDWDWTVPEFIRGMYEAPAEAVNVGVAQARGVPTTEEQRAEAAFTAAGMLTIPAPFRGEMRPNVVSAFGAGPRREVPRSIDPETGLYSRSYEAAQALPQSVGTPEQMRSALLKGGASEEELLYSGVDQWLAGLGTDRVTKDQIIAALGNSAAGKGNVGMPYRRVSLESSGVTGDERDIGDLRASAYSRMRDEAIDARNKDIESRLSDLGYTRVTSDMFDTPEKVRSMLTTIDEAYRLPPDQRNSVPYNLYTRLKKVDRLLAAGSPIDSYDVREVLAGLDPAGYFLNKSGVPEYGDDIVERELSHIPAYRDNPNYGGLSHDEYANMHHVAENMPEDELASYMGLSPEELRGAFKAGDTEYARVTIPGLRNYRENLYKYDDAGRGVLAGAYREQKGQPYQNPHFRGKSPEESPIMFHTRTGNLETPEGKGHLVFEMQSDVGQDYRRNKVDYVAPNAKTALDLSKDERGVLSSYLDFYDRWNAARKAADDQYNRIVDAYMDDETGKFMKDRAGYAEALESLQKAREAKRALEKDILAFDEENWDTFQKIDDYYGTKGTLLKAMTFGGDFDPSPYKAVLEGTAKAKRGVNKRVTLPFATSTNRWVDAALKNELVAAARDGSEWLLLPKGADVETHTGGELAGQQEFYEKIAPQRLKNLAEKFLPGKAEFKRFDANGYAAREGGDVPTYEVFGLRLTPELREAILKEGLPSFAGGGPVHGSGIDVDVFALR